MTGPNAAYAGQHDDLAIVVHKPQPGERRMLGCPNCHDTLDLVVIETCTIERGLLTAWDVGVDAGPETDVEDFDVAEVLPERPIVTLGVRCGHCRWSFEGPGALGKLTAVP